MFQNEPSVPVHLDATGENEATESMANYLSAYTAEINIPLR